MWVRTTEGTHPCAGDTIGRAMKTELEFKTISIGSVMGRNEQVAFNKDEHKLLHTGKTIKFSKYRIERIWLDRGLWEMELGVLIDHKLNI